MAKISYNIKANIREASKNIQELIKQANQLRAAMQRVSQIGERTPLNTNLLNALTKAERQIESLNKALDFTKKQFADVGSLKGGLSSIATDNIAKSTNAILRDAEKLEQRLNRIEERSKKAREDIRQAESKASSSDIGMSLSGGYSRSKQLELLRKQAEEVYNAYYKTDPKKYRVEMNRLREGYDRIRAELKEINSVADESFNTVGKIGSALSSVHKRFAFLASRSVALFGLEMIGDSMKNIVSIEQGMAGFEQVMAKGEHATNLFGKSLVDAHPEKFTEGLSHATAEAEVYADQLQEMQNKLLSLAVKYGSTSEEVIESAKLWGRAYKDNNVVLALTDAATKLAIADAFDIVTANKALESSIMQWGFEIKNTNDAISVSNRIIDSWTALSHNYTVSANTLVEANRRMAQSAKVVGVGFHEAQALVAVMARKTMADGGEIGNALKSIFGSIHSAKAIKALQDFGVEVYQVGENGEKSFRRVDAVLTDLMIKAQTTNRNMEDLLKSISGGKWQWNKAGAMLDLTEYLKALTISTTAYGFTNEQVGMQLDTVARKLQSVKSELDKLMAEGGSANTIIKGLLDTILGFLKWVDRIPVGFFETIAAITATRLAWRMLRNSAVSDSGFINRATKTMTTTMRMYSMQVNAATGVVGKSVKGIGSIFSGLFKIFGRANVIIAGVTLALDLFTDAITAQRDAIKDNIDSHSKMLQIYQEQADRLAEAGGTLDTLINAYNQLTDAIAQEGEGTENANKLDEQRSLVKKGIINIVGEEAAAVIDGSNINQEEQQKMKNALQKRQDHLRVMTIEEGKLLAQSADNLREMVDSDIKALNDESTSWIKLISLIFQYAGAWDAVKATFFSVAEAFNKGRLNRLQDNLEDAQAELAAAKEAGVDTTVEEMKVKGAQAEIAATQAAVEEDQTGLQKIKDVAKIKALEEARKATEEVTKVVQGVVNTSNSAANTGYIGGGSGGGGSTGSSRGGGSTATAKENEPIAIQLARRLIEKYHLSPEEAAGIIGNAMRESGGDGFDLNPRANNGSHLGIFQWATNGVDDRWENYVAWAAANKMDVWNAQNQLDFYMYERDSFEKSYWDDIRKMNPYTPEEWAHAINLYSERSGDDSYLSGRQGNARDVYEYLRSHPGSGGSYEDPAKNEAVRLKDVYDKALAGLDYSADAMKNNYEKALDEIDNKTKITGHTVDTFNERMKIQDDYVTKIKESIDSYNKALEETKKQFDDNEKNVFKNTTKMDLDEFYKKSSIEMKKASVDIDKDSLPILNEKLQFVIKLKEQEEKLYKSEQDNIVKSMELRRKSLKEMYDMQVETRRLEYEIWQEETKGRYIAPWYEGSLRQPYLDGIANSEKERYDRAVSDNNKYEGKLYNENELLKMKKGWLDARNAAREYSRTVSDDVRQKTYDVFHSLIIEGNSIKDVWKKLWQGLAEDALKALLRINDGQMSLFGRLISGLFGGGGGGGASATPHADGGLVESEQLYRIGERGKKEMVVPLERNNPRGKMLVRESARRLGMLETKVEPSFKSPQVQNGTVIKQLVSKQTTNMARMEALTQTMVNILTFMANNQANGAVGGNNVVQPVVVKQTMSDVEFMQHFQKMQRMGKLK